jgi:hypothetical protein
LFIEASGLGTQIQLSNVTLSNHGLIEAAQLAAITINLNGDSTNLGTIDAFNGGVITLNENGHSFGNQGLIEASDGGGVSIVGDVTNFDGATIEAIGPNAFVDLSNGMLDNQSGARIEASHRGSITLDSETVTNESGAKIEATHLGTITFDVGPVRNDSNAKIEAKHYGVIAFSGDGVTNNAGAEIEAKDHGVITFDAVGLSNLHGDGDHPDAIILAKDYGAIVFTQTADGPGGIENAGTIEAENHGTVTFQDIGGDNNGGITNTDGTIAAVGLGAVVEFQNSSITDGELKADGGAIIFEDNVPNQFGGHSSVEGSVTVDIGGGGFVDFADAIDASAAVAIAFKGMGTFELDQAPAGPISVTGFGIGDAIDLTNISFNGCISASWTDNTLTVSNGSQMESFSVDGSGNVAVAADAFGGTEVFFGNDVWTNTAGGNWNDEESWSSGVPGGCSTVVIGVSGTYTVAITGESHQVNSLAITDAGATLTGSGHLSVTTTLDNAGIIQPDGCLTIDVGQFDEAGTFINEYIGRVQSLAGNSLTINQESADGSSINYGLFNAAGGNITLDREGSATNHGVLEATAGGTLTIHNHSVATNDGIIQSLGDDPGF